MDTVSTLRTHEPLFNPTSMDFIRNPYPAYRRLRETEPVHRSELGFWVLSRYADIEKVLRDKRFGRNYMPRMRKLHGARVFDELSFRMFSKSIVVLDPPDHTRLRNLMAKAFTNREIETLRPRVQAMVDRLLDDVIDRGHMDVIRDFAHPLPSNMICEILGIPEEARSAFLSETRFPRRLGWPAPMTREQIDFANEQMQFFVDYFGRLIEQRRREPGDDLISRLIQAEEQGDQVTAEDVIANAVLLFIAGHETTTNLIGNGLLALHRHPDQLALLRSDPSLMGNAVDELLRYDTSVQITVRGVLEDVEVAGVQVKKGETLVLLLGAANRDPDIYPDPDRLDIRRSPSTRALGFGGGVHFCLGAQLARLEGMVALSTLLRRLPTMRLAEIDSPVWRKSFNLRGLRSLPAIWEAGGVRAAS
jgi:cytochrome P450